jgi:hypothetical protein
MEAALNMRDDPFPASMNPYVALKFWMCKEEIRILVNWLMLKIRPAHDVFKGMFGDVPGNVQKRQTIPVEAL